MIKIYPTLRESREEMMSKMSSSLLDVKKDLANYANSNNGKFIFYGSLIKGNFSYTSDIDIIVDFPDGSVDKAWNYAEETCIKYGLTPDVRSIHFCTKEFIHGIMEYAEIVDGSH